MTSASYNALKAFKNVSNNRKEEVLKNLNAISLSNQADNLKKNETILIKEIQNFDSDEIKKLSTDIYV